MNRHPYVLDEDLRGVSMTTGQAVEVVRIMRDQLLMIPPSARDDKMRTMLRAFDQIVHMWAAYQAELIGAVGGRH